MNAFRLAVVVAVARACWRARMPTAQTCAFAVLVGMLLVSPVSWTHYFLLLALPVALVWSRLPAGPARWAMWAAFAVMWLPDNLMPLVVMGPEQAVLLARDHNAPVPPWENLVAISAPHYALLALFVLTLLLPARADVPPKTSRGRGPVRPTTSPTRSC